MPARTPKQKAKAKVKAGENGRDVVAETKPIPAGSEKTGIPVVLPASPTKPKASQPTPRSKNKKRVVEVQQQNGRKIATTGKTETLEQPIVTVPKQVVVSERGVVVNQKIPAIPETPLAQEATVEPIQNLGEMAEIAEVVSDNIPPSTPHVVIVPSMPKDPKWTAARAMGTLSTTLIGLLSILDWTVSPLFGRGIFWGTIKWCFYISISFLLIVLALVFWPLDKEVRRDASEEGVTIELPGPVKPSPVVKKTPPVSKPPAGTKIPAAIPTLRPGRVAPKPTPTPVEDRPHNPKSDTRGRTFTQAEMIL